MAIRTRLQRLLRRAAAVRLCRCPLEQTVVRFGDDPEPDLPDSGGVCPACGLPRPPGLPAQVVIHLPGLRADAAVL